MYNVRTNMPVVTVRVDEKLKREMERLTHINWSEVIRTTVEHKIKAESERNLAEAVLLNERLRKKAPEGWDSTRVIKLWRQKR
jgi:Arc/MetJ-type ribon-helix-helix transcriptional regulator